MNEEKLTPIEAALAAAQKEGAIKAKQVLMAFCEGGIKTQRDSGVWGITQEYFDKVYPKRKRKCQQQ